MRTEMNPNRKLKVTGFAKYVAASIVHLPNLKEYHAQRFDVVKCSLETMRRNAGLDCQIYVWDNGSCSEFRKWLIEEYKPDFLMLSANVGKSNARAGIVNSLPDDTVFSMSDDDMFFYPGWFKSQVEILDAFPIVGTVSGWPVRTQFRFSYRTGLKWGRDHGAIRWGKWITKQEDKDFCSSIGRDYQRHLQTSKNDTEFKLSWRGKEAYGTGHHAQFIGTAKTLKPFAVTSEQAMRTERDFEDAIDKAGLLRLTTCERNCRHIGNILDKDLEVLWQS